MAQMDCRMFQVWLSLSQRGSQGDKGRAFKRWWSLADDLHGQAPSSRVPLQVTLQIWHRGHWSVGRWPVDGDVELARDLAHLRAMLNGEVVSGGTREKRGHISWSGLAVLLGCWRVLAGVGTWKDVGSLVSTLKLQTPTQLGAHLYKNGIL